MIDKITDTFYPNIYNKKLSTSGDIELCLLKGAGISRYCLAVIELNDSTSLNTQIKEARTQVAKLVKAYWLIREVGLYLVVISKDSQHPDISELKTDRTGFHSVILQGIHFISENGNHIFNHSKWLNHTFGGANEISQTLQAIT